MAKEVQQVTLNLLSEGTEICGDFSASNDIRIDGLIRGNIKTTGRIVIGPTAKIEGDITASAVDIIGVMDGDIFSSGVVTLKEKSVVTGNIKTPILLIEAGAIFNGNCQVDGDKSM